MNSLPAHEAQTARSMLLCAAAALGDDARRAVLAPSVGKDDIATFVHALGVIQLVAQPHGLQAGDDAHVFAHAAGFDVAVQLAGLVADAHDDHGGAATVRIGFGLDEGSYVFVVGAWRCALKELRLHGAFSGFEAALLFYLAKYLHKVCGDEADLGDLGALCLRADTSARNDSCGAVRAVRPWTGFSDCKDRFTPEQLAKTLPTQAATGPMDGATVPPRTTLRNKYCAPLRGTAQL